MYLHLGGDVLVKTDDIVGLFDLDNSTVSAKTRDFLKTAEKEKKVVYVSYELPKSFCVAKEKGSIKVYISQMSTSTLRKRLDTEIS